MSLLWFVVLFGFGEQLVQIEGPRVHREFPLRRARPLFVGRSQ